MMGRRRVGKKRVIIGATICIASTIIATLGIGTIRVVNANKITSLLELGIKYSCSNYYSFFSYSSSPHHFSSIKLHLCI